MSRDLEQHDGRTVERPGGVVHHAGLALLRLGATVRVLTRVHPADDGLLMAIRSEGAEVRALDSRQTTTCRNDYTGPIDRHELLATSDPIGTDQLPPEWRDADLTHLGPLHRRDLEPEVTRCAGGLVGLDLQGLLRRSEAGATRLEPNPALPRFLNGAEVVHANQEEIEVVLEGDSLEGFVKRHSIPEMLVTRGAGGAVLVEKGRRVDIPARPTNARHCVGAGDVFLATYLLLRVQGLASGEAARGAAQACALRIEVGEIPRGFRVSGAVR
jgi:fructokinase